jgi:hypothetical protein
VRGYDHVKERNIETWRIASAAALAALTATTSATATSPA